MSIDEIVTGRRFHRSCDPVPSQHARILKRLPCGSGGPGSEIHLAHFLVALLRVRTEKHFVKNKVFLRIMRRLIHIIAQAVEVGIESHLLTECPAPTLLEKYHPFLKSSRLRGNRALALNMVSRFQARGSGYVSGKDECSLKQLGVLQGSSFANRTSSEFCARLLCKNVTFMEEYLQHSENKNNRNVNICFDAARVCSEQVACSFKSAQCNSKKTQRIQRIRGLYTEWITSVLRLSKHTRSLPIQVMSWTVL